MARFHNIALVLHRFGNTRVFLVFSFFVAVLLISVEAFEQALIFILAFTFAMGATTVLKILFRVKRPEGAERYEPNSYAFPSGHATGVFFLAVTLGNFALMYLTPLWAGVGIVFFIVFALVITASRMVLNVHTMLQVVVGAMIGIFVPLIIILSQNLILSLFTSL